MRRASSFSASNLKILSRVHNFPKPRRQPLHAHRPGFNGLGEYVGRAENRDGLPRAGDRGIDEFARERARGQSSGAFAAGSTKAIRSNSVPCDLWTVNANAVSCGGNIMGEKARPPPSGV